MDLLSQIKKGADFAELAKANSACPSSAQGGDLGFFKRGRMLPAFEKAAFELETGQISDVVETRFGYHIIKVTGRKDTFEQFKDDLIEELKSRKKSEIAAEYIQSLRAQANIVYHDPTLQKEQKIELPPAE
jgi:peptidyl-prolyl cis-trans isomerase C